MNPEFKRQLDRMYVIGKEEGKREKLADATLDAARALKDSLS